MDRTEYWLQFTENGEEKFWLFNIEHTEQPLSEESSNAGYEILCEEYGIDFNILKSLPAITYYEMNQSLTPCNQLVFKVEYSGGGGEYNDGFDVEIRLIGYLSEYKELIKVPTAAGMAASSPQR